MLYKTPPSTYDWAVTVKLPDGRERVLHPHHLVLPLDSEAVPRTSLFVL